MNHLYSPLFTDLYQLTMAQGYFILNKHEQMASFHFNFKTHPFGGNYALSCGLQTLVAYLSAWRFDEDALAYLATLKNRAGDTLFSKQFLNYLKHLQLTCHLYAVPEGHIVFADEPLIRVEGPLLQCQLIETALLTIINFQTLIATQSSRICQAASGDAVIELGMRRAQGLDGALSASRAAYIGGCVATSNVLAGKLFDIPVRGTQAHSWIVAFPTEQAAFDAYISIMPHDSILLVDTYNTLKGIKHAIEAGKKLRANGLELLGIRLDSGDLLSLSLKARKLLDAAGFKHTQIIASNALNEIVIRQLKERRAPITTFGVGTHLVTAYEQPALDGVYKLSALQKTNGAWDYKLKLSESARKMTHPGRHQIRRLIQHGKLVKDIIYDIELGLTVTDQANTGVDLLQPIIANGKLVASLPTIHDIRTFAMKQVEQFYQQWQHMAYPVELEKQLLSLKQRLVAEKR